MSTGRPYHFTHLLQVSKKSLCSLILYIFFHDLIHVYSPGAGAHSPPGDKVWCQQKLLVTSVIYCQFQIIDDNSFWKIHCFTFFPYKSIRDQIWPCRKICQGQPRVIIWANLVVLKHLMMHTKMQGHWPFGSGEEDFFLVFNKYGHGGHLGSCDQEHLSKLSFPHPIEAPYEIWLWLAQWFLRRRCLKSVDDDGRRRTMDDRGLPILSAHHMSLWLRRAKKPPQTVRQNYRNYVSFHNSE